MATKKALSQPNAPDRSHVFNWGLKVSGFSELLLLTGQIDADPDGNVRHPDDPVAQTQAVFDSLIGMLSDEGWSLDDVIRVEATYTMEVDMTTHHPAIFQIWADCFKDVEVKPAAGQLRRIAALARPGFFVEFEFLCAR